MGVDGRQAMTIERFSEELAELKSSFEGLAARVSAIEGQGGELAAGAGGDSAGHGVDEVVVPDEIGLGEWVSRGAFLQKMAAVSFILVFALLLRTLTDSEFISLRAGTYLGFSYVTLLIATGAILGGRKNPLGLVVSSAGFFLLFSILLEGSEHFRTVSYPAAFLVLFCSLAAGGFIGIRFKSALLLWLVLLGSVLPVFVFNFPRLIFPAGGGVLIFAMVLAYAAGNRQISSALKWLMAGVVLLFWAFWSFKLYLPLTRGEALAADFYHVWFLPELTVFGGLTFVLYIRKYFSDHSVGVFDVILPSMNMALVFLAGRVILVGMWDAGRILGGLAVLLGVVHFLVGWRLATRSADRWAAVGGTFLGAVLVTTAGLPDLTGELGWAVMVWSPAAFGLLLLSGRCQSGMIRGIAYFYQVITLLIGFAAGVFSASSGAVIPGLAAALSLAVVSLVQYRWCLNNPPPSESLFARIDVHDFSAIVFLGCGLAGVFFLLTMGFDLLAAATLAEPDNAMKCARSVVINLGAIMMLLLGGRRHNLDYIWLAVLLGVLGGVNVFIIDLFKSQGLPLVFSVLSFGFLAVTGSIVLGRWQRYKVDETAG